MNNVVLNPATIILIVFQLLWQAKVALN